MRSSFVVGGRRARRRNRGQVKIWIVGEAGSQQAGHAAVFRIELEHGRDVPVLARDDRTRRARRPFDSAPYRAAAHFELANPSGGRSGPSFGRAEIGGVVVVDRQARIHLHRGRGRDHRGRIVEAKWSASVAAVEHAGRQQLDPFGGRGGRIGRRWCGGGRTGGIDHERRNQFARPRLAFTAGACSEVFHRGALCIANSRLHKAEQFIPELLWLQRRLSLLMGGDSETNRLRGGKMRGSSPRTLGRGDPCTQCKEIAKWRGRRFALRFFSCVIQSEAKNPGSYLSPRWRPLHDCGPRIFPSPRMGEDRRACPEPAEG